MLFIARLSLILVRCVFRVACCLLFVFDMCCALLIRCCLLFALCSLIVCWLRVACCFGACWLLTGVRCSAFVVGCWLSVVYCSS